MLAEGQIHQWIGEGGWFDGRWGTGERELPLSICDNQSLEAVLTVDMEALEQFGVFEGIKADGTS